MRDDEVIERYMRRFDRAVGAEPAALTELVASFSDDAVVNLANEPCGLPLIPGPTKLWRASADVATLHSR
jgi:hypothetical protein